MTEPKCNKPFGSSEYETCTVLGSFLGTVKVLGSRSEHADLLSGRWPLRVTLLPESLLCEGVFINPQQEGRTGDGCLLEENRHERMEKHWHLSLLYVCSGLMPVGDTLFYQGDSFNNLTTTLQCETFEKSKVILCPFSSPGESGSGKQTNSLQ